MVVAQRVQKVSHPSDDKRWKIIDATMRRAGNDRHALIETLHAVQESFGYLGDDALRYVAKRLRIPLSTVYGVATFYHYFTLKPPGEHLCVVCLGTACYIKGAPELVDRVSARWNVSMGESSPDGKVTLLSARCVGSCGLAPIAVVDGEVVGRTSPDELVDRIERLGNDDA
ncbi:NADP-reducing hydrogenase subunit HndA [Planctomycetes bacterium Pan216]|uniref:NADP-reducing hydrogenase subunit HndA n=1 Tax=Kolteria novifilia TaxID=2527975 RepID=A0A518AYD2_9BACT|nr:NADP-reducing hydrogenase subunit HndA [Planctomycetes bacterium Pan216]